MKMRMMRHVLAVIFFGFLSQGVYSNEIRKSQVRTGAEAFLQNRKMVLQESLVHIQHLRIGDITAFEPPQTEDTLGFIVHLNPEGFIAMSSDDHMPPVLAYSFHNSWSPDTSQSNVLYHLLAYDLEREPIDFEIQEKNREAWESLLSVRPVLKSPPLFQQWPEPGTTETGGWVETTWHQEDPYNRFCPIDPQNGDRCIVGCVATAMAQVIHYHRYMGNPLLTDEDRYQTLYREILIDDDSLALDFPSFSKLNGYLNQIQAKYQQNIPLDTLELAALNFACGIFLHMYYTSTASGASGSAPEDALKLKFGYANATFTYPLDDILSEREFFQTLRQNMMNGYPALLGSLTHEIICDGYNTDSFYHLNYGCGHDKPEPIQLVWYYLPADRGYGFRDYITGVLDIRPTHPKPTGLAFDQTTIHFGGIFVHNLSSSRFVTLYNDTSDSIIIENIVSSRYFGVSYSEELFTDSLDALTVLSGDSVRLFFQFAPDSAGLILGEAILSTSEGAAIPLELIGYGVPNHGTIVDSSSVLGHWNRNGSPYYICNDIYVMNNEKLIVEQGTEIVFMGYYSLTIPGDSHISVRGAVGDSVRFFSYDSERDWRGILKGSGIGSDTLSYCTITGVGGGSDEFYHSASPIISNSPLVITHSRIYGNQSSPAAIINCGSDVTVSYCTIENNHCFGNGIIAFRRKGLVTHCRITKNFSSQGTIYLFSTNECIEIRNTIIDGNKSTIGGGVSSNNSSFLLENSILCQNEAVFGGGICIFKRGTHKELDIVLRNSILWANEADEGTQIRGFDMQPEDSLWISHCMIDQRSEDWISVDPSLNWFADGMGGEDPEFMGVEEGDFRLREDSPCIDGGHPDPRYNDPEDPFHPGYALWPARGTVRNDMGVYGGSSWETNSNIASDRKTFVLEQNFPNPFNNETIIFLNTVETSLIKLDIYNVLGQRIKCLINQRLDPGFYQILWNGQNELGSKVASGVYFYHLKAGKQIVTKKMLFIQ